MYLEKKKFKFLEVLLFSVFSGVINGDMRKEWCVLWTLGLACTIAAACPCPPGTHCPGEGEQGCINCPTGTYQDKQTSGIFCIDCRISCGKREVKKQDCSAISNMICECMKGYFKPAGHNGLCLPHKPCPPGQGVKTAGLYTNNTDIMSD